MLQIHAQVALLSKLVLELVKPANPQQMLVNYLQRIYCLQRIKSGFVLATAKRATMLTRTPQTLNEK